MGDDRGFRLSEQEEMVGKMVRQWCERTREFWDQVRDRWSKVFADRGTVTLKGPVDKLGLFQPLFAHADAIAQQGAAASKKNQEVIESALRQMGAVPGEENGGN